jgi:hypothetical protein
MKAFFITLKITLCLKKAEILRHWTPDDNSKLSNMIMLLRRLGQVPSNTIVLLRQTEYLLTWYIMTNGLGGGSWWQKTRWGGPWMWMFLLTVMMTGLGLWLLWQGPRLPSRIEYCAWRVQWWRWRWAACRWQWTTPSPPASCPGCYSTAQEGSQWPSSWGEASEEGQSWVDLDPCWPPQQSQSRT